ncbi:CapA family protein [bacterium]|nr:CapA family protein [bacterium]
MKISLALLLTISLLFGASHASAQTVTIKAVGDIMMGTKYPTPNLPPDDGKGLFLNVEDTLKGSDLLLGNLEGVFSVYNKSEKNVGTGKYYAFNMPIYYAQYLKSAGFDVLNIANNHSRDFGEDGLSDTIFTLQLNDLKYTGLRDTLTIVNRNGLKIGIMGFYWNDYFNSILDLESTMRRVSENRGKVDILIVTFHGGAEGTAAAHTSDKMEYMGKTPRGNVVAFARSAVEAGADLVLGHGPHLPRAMEIYGGRLIAYSLGNFCTYGSFSMKATLKYSLILEIEMDEHGFFKSGRIHPVILLDRGIPHHDPEKTTIGLIQELTKTDFPDTPLHISDEGEISIK